MATIRFSCGPHTHTVTAAGGAKSETLLEIARRHGVPLMFNCESGACGACLVRIRPLPGNKALLENTGELEQLMFRAMEIDLSEDSSPRLACQYRVADDACISVRYDTSIGSE